MKNIPFVKSIITENYSDYEEDKRGNVAILILLDFMLITIMSIWAIIFHLLKMPEMFWLVIITLLGFIAAFIGLATHKMKFGPARFLSLLCGMFITAIPPMYYGIDCIVMVHLAFLALSTILMFSRKERPIFIKYFYAIIAIYIFEIVWYFAYGPIFKVEANTYKIFNIIVGLDMMLISVYFTYFFFGENTDFKDLLANEREKSDHLLLSIFPEAIANKLKKSNQSVADSFDDITIIFADIVGFTEYSHSMGPQELVNMLDQVFSEFDKLVDKYNIEKIKTIGDAYMAVCGLPNPDPKHCHNVADLALEITDVIKEKFQSSYQLKLRIGIHTGKAVAGVIGNKKFAYDLWGDSVNVASRFEMSGEPEKIHITHDVKNMLGDSYLFEDRGEILIKGKGMMRSYFLLDKIDSTVEEKNF